MNNKNTKNKTNGPVRVYITAKEMSAASNNPSKAKIAEAIKKANHISA